MKMLRTITMMAMLTLGMTLMAQTEIANGIKVNPNGTIEIGKVIAEIHHFGEGYSFMSHSSAVQETASVDAGMFSLSTKFRTADGGNFDLTEIISKVSDSSVSVSVSVSMASAGGINTDELSFSFILPVDAFSGIIVVAGMKSITLPTEFKESFLGWFPDTNKIEIPMPDGKKLEISAADGQNIDFLAQDNRKWDNPTYVLRVNFKPSKGKPIFSSKLDFKIELKK